MPKLFLFDFLDNEFFGTIFTIVMFGRRSLSFSSLFLC